MTHNQRRRFAGNAYNLTPYQFQYLPEDERREIARKGGVASGKRRRELAEARDVCADALIVYGLQIEVREHYRAAIKKYAAAELRKRKRRKATNE